MKITKHNIDELLARLDDGPFKTLCKYIADSGMSQKDVCEKLGRSEQVFCRWKRNIKPCMTAEKRIIQFLKEKMVKL